MTYTKPKPVQNAILLTLISTVFSLIFEIWRLSLTSKLLDFDNIFGMTFSSILILFLISMVSKRKKWAWILFCIINAATIITTPFSRLLVDVLQGVLTLNFFSVLINATLIFINGYCLYLLLKSESRSWFNKSE